MGFASTMLLFLMIPRRARTPLVLPTLWTLRPLLTFFALLDHFLKHRQAVIKNLCWFCNQFGLIDSAIDESSLIDKLISVFIVLEPHTERESILTMSRGGHMFNRSELFLQQLLYLFLDQILITLMFDPHVFIDDVILDIGSTLQTVRILRRVSLLFLLVFVLLVVRRLAFRAALSIAFGFWGPGARAWLAAFVMSRHRCFGVF